MTNKTNKAHDRAYRALTEMMNAYEKHAAELLMSEDATDAEYEAALSLFKVALEARAHIGPV